MNIYKKMYLKMFNAASDAVKILQEAQQECEEMFISEEDRPASADAPLQGGE